MRTSLWMITVVGAAFITLPCAASATGTAPAHNPASEPASHTATSPASKSTPSQDKPWNGKVEKASVTRHTITVQGETFDYRATAATMPMTDEDGKVKATVFFVAYERLAPAPNASAETQTQPAPQSEGETLAQKDPADRRVTFLFNGGPGSAAVWLHLGAAGPKRLAMDPNGFPLAPPYRLDDNPQTWLDISDLVFIDPVGTGYSRPAKGEKGKDFYGVEQDIRCVADFIRLYVTRYRRWASPMFLAGESYGTTRAAGLSEYLLERYGIALNGVVLISSVLDFRTLSLTGYNDAPYILYLPTYTAIAWYHHKLDAELQNDLPAALREVERWARDTYSVALAQGDTLPADQREEVIRKLARYTALPSDLIDKADLRIAPGVFRKHLLADRHQVLGRFDGRVTGFDPEALATQPPYDPSMNEYFAAYSSTFNDYVRRTLQYESTLPYEVLSERVWPWDFGSDGHQGYLCVADDLREAMIKNPHMKTLFASGYFDLATPFAATNNTIHRLLLSPDLRKNIQHVYYRAGHMVYHPAASLAKLKADIATWMASEKHAVVPAEVSGTDTR